MTDRDLDALMEDAVSSIEPNERLADIRAQVRPTRRVWMYVGGALAAAAASVAVVVVTDQSSLQKAKDPTGSTVHPSASASLHSMPTHSPAPDGGGERLPGLTRLFWVGDTLQGDRLFSEPTFINLGYGQTQLDATVRAVIQGKPTDPDYRSAWREWSLVSATENAEGVTIVLRRDGAYPATYDTTLAVDQVNQTVWALLGPVDVTIQADDVVQTVYPTAESLNDPNVLVLSPVQVAGPAEGQEVFGSFVASGTANSYEAKVPWRIENEDGIPVLQGSATAEGWMDRLYPWTTRIDVTGLAAGTYTFVASTDNPAGSEGPPTTTDSRTIIVR